MPGGVETFDVAANEVPKTKEEADTILAIVKVTSPFKILRGYGFMWASLDNDEPEITMTCRKLLFLITFGFLVVLQHGDVAENHLPCRAFGSCSALPLAVFLKSCSMFSVTVISCLVLFFTRGQDIFLFQHLSKKQMADVVRVISREQVQKGDTVIKQGDEGDKFYIVDAGEFDVRSASWRHVTDAEYLEISCLWEDHVPADTCRTFPPYIRLRPRLAGSWL